MENWTEPKNSNTDIGRMGEDIAASYLKSSGYQIIERNYRIGRLGEIDMLAWDGDCLCFIEVKTRKDTGFGTPSEAVDIKKRKRLLKLARIYIGSHDCGGSDIRFDIVEVDYAEPFMFTVNILKNAFGENLI